MKVQVTVVKTFTGVVDIGDLALQDLQHLLEREPTDTNVWELGLDESQHVEVAVQEGS